MLRSLDAKTDGTESYRIAPLRVSARRGHKFAEEILELYTQLMGGL
jgi:hypothetical protein